MKILAKTACRAADNTPKTIWPLIFVQITTSVFGAAGESVSSVYLITRENKRLAGQFIQNIESSSFTSCNRKCLRNSWCTSTNFKVSVEQDDKGTCELSKHEFASINDESGKLIDLPGSTFSMFLKGCMMTGCLNGGSCLFDKKMETFTCSCKLTWTGNKCEFPWRKLNTVPVCFGAKNNQFGRLTVSDVGGSVDAVKLVHASGSVGCGHGRRSKWGCDKGGLIGTLITTSKNAILLPESKEYWYRIPEYNADSKEIVFTGLSNPLLLSSGQELRLWYSEDLKDATEADNGGRTCADVYVKDV